MNNTTLSRVIGWVGNQLAMPTDRQRVEITGRINQVRSWLFSYRQIREIHFMTQGCECVETFVEPCRDRCGKLYQGFTLPAGIRAAEEIYVQGTNVAITEARVWSQTCCPDRIFGYPSCFKAEKLQDCYLKRPVPQDYEGRITFRSTEPKDEGKKCGVEYKDRNDKLRREDVVLSHASPKTTLYSPSVVFELTLPHDRCGVVVIATEDGFELGRYSPGVEIPAHCHYRLNQFPCGCEVAWRAVYDPLPVTFLTDLVEINNEMLWRAAVQAYPLALKQDRTKTEENFLATTLENIAALADTDVTTAANPWATKMIPKNNRRDYGSSELVGGLNYRSPRIWASGGRIYGR